MSETGDYYEDQAAKIARRIEGQERVIPPVNWALAYTVFISLILFFNRGEIGPNALESLGTLIWGAAAALALWRLWLWQSIRDLWREKDYNLGRSRAAQKDRP